MTDSASALDADIAYTTEQLEFVRKFYHSSVKHAVKCHREEQIIKDFTAQWAQYDPDKRRQLAKEVYLKSLQDDSLLKAMYACTVLSQFLEFVR
jgi:hypothetical protein